MSNPTCNICGHGGDSHQYGDPVRCTRCPDRTCQDGPKGRAFREEQAKAQPHPECSIQGHSFEVIAKVMGGDPTHVMCTRCGETWHVERKRPA